MSYQVVSLPATPQRSFTPITDHDEMPSWMCKDKYCDLHYYTIPISGERVNKQCECDLMPYLSEICLHHRLFLNVKEKIISYSRRV